jgi:hypothetical protein
MYGSEGHFLHGQVAALRNKREVARQHPRSPRTEPDVGYPFQADQKAEEHILRGPEWRATWGCST